MGYRMSVRLKRSEKKEEPFIPIRTPLLVRILLEKFRRNVLRGRQALLIKCFVRNIFERHPKVTLRHWIREPPMLISHFSTCLFSGLPVRPSWLYFLRRASILPRSGFAGYWRIYQKVLLMPTEETCPLD